MKQWEEWELREHISYTTAMQKWLNSAQHAMRGIALMLKTERNSRIELSIALIVIVMSAWLRVSITEWCLILICIAGLIAAEAINTSIERLSDYQTMEIDPRIRDIKDIAAGAVMMMAVVGGIVGCLILLPKIYFRLLSP